MQLVFVFAERLINMFLVNVFKIMTVIRTLRISTLMYNKVFTVFLMRKRMRTVRTAQDNFAREFISMSLKFSATNFTQNLIVRTVVLVKILFRSFTVWASTIIGNITNRTAFDRSYNITVTPFDIRNEVLVKPNFALDNDGWFINFELLILRRIRIIKPPLFKRDIFTNKIKKIQNNLQKVLILYQ